jgi:indolepyruvate ferredoxin oxidoreductase beta subunit
MVGVGGQGVVLASDALAEIAMKNGYDVKKSDTLGMAQRGGSVSSHVRLGEHVFSPIMSKGDADFLLAFELLEGARSADYLRQGGVAIINDQAVPPLSVVGDASAYPSTREVERIIRRYTDEVYFLPGREIAEEMGNAQVLNVLLLGFLSRFLAMDEQAYIGDLSQRVPARFLELNLRAFSRGREEAESRRLAKPTGIQERRRSER